MRDAPDPASSWHTHLRTLLTLARIGAIRPWHYAVPLALTFLAATLEGASLALLVPLGKGLASDNFGVIWDVPGFRTFHATFPDALAFVGTSNRGTFVFIVALLFAASLLGVAASYAAARICAWRNGVYAARVKSHTLARCLSFGKLYFDRTSQATVSEVIGFSEVILRVLTAIEVAVDSAFRLVAIGLVMLAISWPMTLFVALALPALREVDRRIVRRSLRAAEEAVETEHQFSGQVFNVISSIPLVKAFALEARTRRLYEDLVEQIRRLSLVRESAALVAAPLQQAVTLVALLLVVLVAVALAKSDHTAELSVMCAFLIVARRAIPLLGFPTDLRIRLAQARPALERLAGVFDDGGKCFVASGPREFHGLRQGIEFRDLSFAYVDGLPVLRRLSCTLRAGKTTALVGETGCGKTTAASLLARLYECPPGALLLDGIDIREFSRESLAHRIAYVGQDAWLFNDTIRANLVIGLDRPTVDEELLEVLNHVRLGAMVGRLPAGLDSKIGDRGVQLSGGEKQRLCIARALLRRADLVLLDEATSALDSQTEREVLAALERATRGATVVMIAHRLSTVRTADKILVLSRGEVIEQGAWDQLIGARGPFAAMWQAQSQWPGERPATAHGQPT